MSTGAGHCAHDRCDEKCPTEAYVNPPGQMTAHGSSAGHVLSGPEWLDVHFAAAATAYEALLDAAGFAHGWDVLDAGCGSGPFLPLLRQRVGDAGRVYAMDLAAENIDAACRDASVSVRPALGSVTHLPYRDGAFDGAWSANVLQYFDDEDAVSIVAEMRRAVRPGGIVAVKDVDMTAWRISPAPPFLGAHLAEACIRGEGATTQSFGSLRGRELHNTLRQAGLQDVRQASLLIEYTHPLSDAAVQLWSEWLPYLAALAVEKGVPDEDLNVWRQVATPELARRFVQAPEFYGCELQTTAAGTVS